MFRTHITRLCAALCLLSLCLSISTRPASALTVNVIPITGQLLIGGAPVTGNYDLQFQLYTAATGGTTVGPLVTVTNVAVADGVFYAEVNFGALSLGNPLFVQTNYRTAGSGNYSILTPRHTVPSVVYAAYTPYASFAGNTNTITGHHINTVAPTMGQTLVYDGTQWTPSFIGASSLALPLALSAANAYPILSVTNTGNNGDGIDASSAGGNGVYGRSSSGVGVSGSSTSGVGVSGNSGGFGVGVYGTNNSNGDGVAGSSSSGTGVDGNSTSGIGISGSSGSSFGVYGANSNNSDYGFLGGVDPRYKAAAGVFGSDNGGGNGVLGISTTSTGVAGNSDSGYGVYGLSKSSYAGYFDGNVHVNGNLSKSGGSFKIDHPLDPEHKYLYHSFVESPDMKNIYDGVVTLDARGQATVTMPDWFEALNQDFRYQLTAIGAPGPNLYIASEITSNQFGIAGGQPGAKVSWQVTGTRHDVWANAHRIPTEEVKPAQEQGTYLHPKEWGQPEERGVDYARTQKVQSKN